MANKLFVGSLAYTATDDDLAAFFAALVVADGTKVFAMQLIKLNLLGRLDGVVDAYGDGDQEKPDVAFPDGSHCECLRGDVGQTRSLPD